MKRFLIALLGIGLSLTLAIFHSSLKADARPTTQSMAAAVAQSTAQVVPTQSHLIFGHQRSLSQRCRFTHFEQIVKGMAGKTLPKPRVALMAHLYWAMSFQRL